MADGTPDVSHVTRLYTLLLLKAKPRHGYSIITEIGEMTGDEPSTSHVYPFLSDLEEQGYVEAEKTGDRGKKVYRLTADGEAFVDEQVGAFGQMLQAVLENSIVECDHCTCKVYDDGFEQDGNMYCCRHCAAADSPSA